MQDSDIIKDMQTKFANPSLIKTKKYHPFYNTDKLNAQYRAQEKTMSEPTNGQFVDLKDSSNLPIDHEISPGYNHCNTKKSTISATADAMVQPLKMGDCADQSTDGASNLNKQIADKDKYHQTDYKSLILQKELDWYKDLIAKYEIIIGEKSTLISNLNMLLKQQSRDKITCMQCHNEYTCQKNYKNYMNHKQYAEIGNKKFAYNRYAETVGNNTDTTWSRIHGYCGHDTEINDEGCSTSKTPYINTMGEKELCELSALLGNLKISDKTPHGQNDGFTETRSTMHNQEISNTESLSNQGNAEPLNYYVPCHDQLANHNSHVFAAELEFEKSINNKLIEMKTNNEKVDGLDVLAKNYTAINDHMQSLSGRSGNNVKQADLFTERIAKDLTCTTKDSYFDEISNSSSDNITKISSVNIKPGIEPKKGSKGSAKKQVGNKLQKDAICHKTKNVIKHHTNDIQLTGHNLINRQIKEYNKLYVTRNDTVILNGKVEDTKPVLGSTVADVQELRTLSQLFDIHPADETYKKLVEKEGNFEIKRSYKSKHTVDKEHEADEQVDTANNVCHPVMKKHTNKQRQKAFVYECDYNIYNGVYNERIADFSTIHHIPDFDINSFNFAGITEQGIKRCKKFNLRKYNEDIVKYKFKIQEVQEIYDEINKITNCPFIAYFYAKIEHACKNEFFRPAEARKMIWKGKSSEIKIAKRPKSRIWYVALVILWYYKIGDFMKDGSFALRKRE